jgi:hypothetical protein
VKKIIGKVSQINMYILILSVLFVVFNFTLMSLFPHQTMGPFYLREFLSLAFASLSLKLFFKVENRYKEEE